MTQVFLWYCPELMMVMVESLFLVPLVRLHNQIALGRNNSKNTVGRMSIFFNQVDKV